jgi:L-malate glycosyltransferase
VKPVVLHLIDSFAQGGSERQALQLTRLLHSSRRFNVRLACLKDEGSLRDEISDLDLGPISAYPLSSFYDLNAATQLWRLVSHLKSQQVQILQTHDFYTNVFGLAAGAIARVPVRIGAMRETAGMRSKAQARLQQLVYPLAHQVVANSEVVRRKLIADGLRQENVTVVYNGLDINRITPKFSRAETLKALELPDESQWQQRYVTIVANMRHEVKDYPMFLRAARRVVEAAKDVRFLMAGEGELSNSLRALAAEYGLINNVKFLGRCSLVGELLSISDICVLTSKAEGFSNSILEYMAASRPVVATNVGGASEAIVEGVTGFLVPSSDDELMAGRIIRLLNEPETALEMGQAGRRVVEEKFSCKAQLEVTEALYDRLLVGN